jgi:hypothetical protein
MIAGRPWVGASLGCWSARSLHRRALGCLRLDDDERKLRTKYAGKPKIVDVIDAASTNEVD